MPHAFIPAVNYHLWAPCNMRCRFCFAPFDDVRARLPKGHLPEADTLEVVRLLAAAGFEKINFVGGEPLLCPWLPALIGEAHRHGLTTSIVTNGSRLDAAWLDRVSGQLDWVGISVDASTEALHRTLGRATRGAALPSATYAALADLVHARGLRLKVNTVVTALNADDDFVPLLAAMRPERWKVFQMLPVAGQNDDAADLLVPDAAFEAYVARHRPAAEALGVTVVPESNAAMRASYVMVDPAGRFYDNAQGGHRYSRPILQVGVRAALSDVDVNAARFAARGGRYAWRRPASSARTAGTRRAGSGRRPPSIPAA